MLPQNQNFVNKNRRWFSPAAALLLIELFPDCLFVVLADDELDAEEHGDHENNRNTEHDEYVLHKACEEVACSRNARNGESVRQLG